MNATSILLVLINGYKTYSAAIAAVAAGAASILAKDYSRGASDVLQVLTLVFGAVAIAGLRHAVDKVPDAVLDAAGRGD